MSRVSYFYDGDVGNFYYAQGHPMKPYRMRMTHNLLVAYGLVDKLTVHTPPRATERDLTRFHADDYVHFLKTVTPDAVAEHHTLLSRFNVLEDCPVFDGLWEHCQISAGGSLAGAARLNNGESDIAINWAGGLHHAKKAEASGFCYVNDCVLAILELLKVHARVLYVDIDIHHGDGVEEAFYSTDRVMTASFHKFGGFFPGTGHVDDVGTGRGKNYAVNFPLKDGIDDESYREIFLPVMEKIMQWYAPGAVVLQCGADSLTGDRLGCFNLSLRGHAQCVDFLKAYNVPLLLLGGGGYTIRNVARCWAYETSRVVGAELSDSLPFNDNLEFYAPEFRLHIVPSNMENHNTRVDLENNKAKIIEQLRGLPCAPSAPFSEPPRGPGPGAHYCDVEDSADPDRRPRSNRAKRVHEYEDSDDEGGDGTGLLGNLPGARRRLKRPLYSAGGDDGGPTTAVAAAAFAARLAKTASSRGGAPPTAVRDSHSPPRTVEPRVEAPAAFPPYVPAKKHRPSSMLVNERIEGSYTGGSVPKELVHGVGVVVGDTGVAAHMPQFPTEKEAHAAMDDVPADDNDAVKRMDARIGQAYRRSEGSNARLGRRGRERENVSFAARPSAVSFGEELKNVGISGDNHDAWITGEGVDEGSQKREEERQRDDRVIATIGNVRPEGGEGSNFVRNWLTNEDITDRSRPKLEKVSHTDEKEINWKGDGRKLVGNWLTNKGTADQSRGKLEKQSHSEEKTNAKKNEIERGSPAFAVPKVPASIRSHEKKRKVGVEDKCSWKGKHIDMGKRQRGSSTFDEGQDKEDIEVNGRVSPAGKGRTEDVQMTDFDDFRRANRVKGVVTSEDSASDDQRRGQGNTREKDTEKYTSGISRNVPSDSEPVAPDADVETKAKDEEAGDTGANRSSCDAKSNTEEKVNSTENDGNERVAASGDDATERDRIIAGSNHGTMLGGNVRMNGKSEDPIEDSPFVEDKTPSKDVVEDWKNGVSGDISKLPAAPVTAAPPPLLPLVALPGITAGIPRMPPGGSPAPPPKSPGLLSGSSPSGSAPSVSPAPTRKRWTPAGMAAPAARPSGSPTASRGSVVPGFRSGPSPILSASAGGKKAVEKKVKGKKADKREADEEKTDEKKVKGKESEEKEGEVRKDLRAGIDSSLERHVGKDTTVEQEAVEKNDLVRSVAREAHGAKGVYSRREKGIRSVGGNRNGETERKVSLKRDSHLLSMKTGGTRGDGSNVKQADESRDDLTETKRKEAKKDRPREADVPKSSNSDGLVTGMKDASKSTHAASGAGHNAKDRVDSEADEKPAKDRDERRSIGLVRIHVSPTGKTTASIQKKMPVETSDDDDPRNG